MWRKAGPEAYWMIVLDMDDAKLPTAVPLARVFVDSVSAMYL
jgi:hypothetical protein